MAHNASHGEVAKPQTAELWKTFWILLVITAVEFAVAFGIDTDNHKWLKISIFIFMTIVKAAYIVGVFMHLKNEAKRMIWGVILPCIFVLWLILALVYFEGGYIYFENYIFK